MRTLLRALLTVVVAVVVTGCATSINSMALPYMDSAEAYAFCHNNARALRLLDREGRHKDPSNKNFALYNMTYAIAATEEGDYPRALFALRNVTGTMRTGVGRNRGMASVALMENIKYFKGTVHEQIFAFALQGALYYHAGDDEKAQASLRLALLVDDKLSLGDSRGDVPLAYFFLARSMLRSGDTDNLAIATRRLKHWAPNCPFCDGARLKNDNAVFVVGYGKPPVRAIDRDPAVDVYFAGGSAVAGCTVTIDGTAVGRCVQVFDASAQAAGRSVPTRHKVQAGKGVVTRAGGGVLDKATGGRFTGLGGDYIGKADLRAFPTMPGFVAVVTAQVPPGMHMLRIDALDSAGRVMPRYAYSREIYAVPSDRHVVTYVRLGFDRQAATASRRRCGTPNEYNYPDDDARFQTTYKKFWPRTRTAPARYRRYSFRHKGVQVCLDGVPCPAGMKPAALGGKDYRMPSAAVLADWQRRGFFAGKSLDEVLGRYADAGFRLPEGDLRGCGRHALDGGKCIFPPAPGATLFERIVLRNRWIVY